MTSKAFAVGEQHVSRLEKAVREWLSSGALGARVENEDMWQDAAQQTLINYLAVVNMTPRSRGG